MALKTKKKAQVEEPMVEPTVEPTEETTEEIQDTPQSPLTEERLYFECGLLKIRWP